MKTLYLFETVNGCIWIVSDNKKDALVVFRRSYPKEHIYSTVALGKVLV